MEMLETGEDEHVITTGGSDSQETFIRVKRISALFKGSEPGFLRTFTLSMIRRLLKIRL